MCDQGDCEEKYIWESARNFWERLKEYLRAPSLIFDHGNTSGHCISMENFYIVGREVHNITRTIKEAMYIRVNDTFLNRNSGKFQLPHIWDDILLIIAALHLK